MTAPLEVQGSALEAQPEAVAIAEGHRIEGRSLGQIAWMRLKRDKVALGGGVIVVCLVIVAVLAPVITALDGQSPYAFHTALLSRDTLVPFGHFGGISGTHLLGVEPTSGRDIFARIVYGARVSLIVALGSTLLAVVIGVFFGGIAGFFGGIADTFIARTMDLLLSIPQLLFAIALLVIIQAAPGSFIGLSGSTLHIVVLIFVIGGFSGPYIGRIIRGQVLSLREKEFVEAARSMGARSPHILLRQLLPNLWAPILVYSTLLIPTNILSEAALSYLGVGVQPPTASWGQMLSDATSIYQVDPAYMLVPGLAIFITVMAFNLFGDGLRDALDPRTIR
ncbi:MAG TPA: ABC transporter permease [Mycobacteriales bacterium]|nr:ABC transporter permease [Mycobacteriales bacterium]